MADKVQAIGVFGGDDGQLAVAVHDETGIDQPRFRASGRHASGQRSASQACADGMRNVADGNGAGKFALRTIGQSDLNHKGHPENAKTRPVPRFGYVDFSDQLKNSTRRRLEMPGRSRSEEHTSELQSLMRISYAVFC